MKKKKDKLYKNKLANAKRKSRDTCKAKKRKKWKEQQKNWFLQIQTTNVSLYNEIKKVKTNGKHSEIGRAHV